MNEPGPVTSDDRGLTRAGCSSATRPPTASRRCRSARRSSVAAPNAGSRRRDVAPGENYQEAIVRSIRNARAMVLVFSDAANNSDEIKKELSLASRYHVPVMALRIEDVEPSDAFAYELSTRQWIDAFDGWDKSIELACQPHRAAFRRGAGRRRRLPPAARRRTAFSSRRPTGDCGRPACLCWLWRPGRGGFDRTLRQHTA